MPEDYEENGEAPALLEERVPLRHRIAHLRWYVEFLAIAAASAAVPLRYGFDHPDARLTAIVAAEISLAGFFAFLTVLDLLSSQSLRAFIREKGGEAAVLGLFAVLLVTLWAAEGEYFLHDHLGPLVEIYLGLNVLLAFVRLERAVLKLPIRPVQIFAASFAVLILVGACLLCFLPRATSTGSDLGFLDALFTATSATCVTGLVVVDTGSTFTALGHTIIAIMIQLGGLGIMTFAAFFGIAAGQGMGLRERAMMQSALNVDVIGDMGRIVAFILVSTFLIEGAGAVTIYLMGAGAHHPDGAVWFAIFHSISAFCNAGFCLYSSSYEGFRADWSFLLVQMGLVIVGGLGFAVLRDLKVLPVWAWRALRRARSTKPVSIPGPPPRISLHTRVVLVTTVILIAAGAGFFFLFEMDGTLIDMPADQAVLASLFQSVSARTAGFNSVPMGSLAISTMMLMMILMFIGASPGSTGGGIKTSTFAVMFLAVIRMFRGRPDVEVNHRRLPSELLERAMVLGFVYMALVISFILLLSVFEPGLALRDIAFEVVSAFGTVGLSTGVTAGLSAGGKILITVAMFVGRLGPLTLVVAMGAGAARSRYTYPEGKVQIG